MRGDRLRRVLRPMLLPAFALAVFAGIYRAAAAAERQPVAQPRLTVLTPTGGKAGTTVEVAFAGTDLDEPEALFFSHPGIKAEPIIPPPPPQADPKASPTPRSRPPPAAVTKFKVTIAAGRAAGHLRRPPRQQVGRQQPARLRRRRPERGRREGAEQRRRAGPEGRAQHHRQRHHRRRRPTSITSSSPARRASASSSPAWPPSIDSRLDPGSRCTTPSGQRARRPAAPAAAATPSLDVTAAGRRRLPRPPLPVHLHRRQRRSTSTA